MPKKLIYISLGFLLLMITVAAIFFYGKYRQSLRTLKDPKELAKQENKILLERVGKLIELPQGETPTIATVSDKDKLKSQPFFKNAENGDKVLIYSKAKKAILYRFSTNKIIEVGPINIQSPPQVTPSSAPSTPTKIKISQ